MILKILTVLLPWKLKRFVLQKWLGYKLHPTARIGFSWIYPDQLEMAAGASIAHFTVAVNLDFMKMGEQSSIGRNNWITGFSTKIESMHFRHQVGRKAGLVLGYSSAITKNHHIDCTNLIQIGQFATIAGYDSQLLTHSINIRENRQDSAPIIIGDYTFVGTNVVILGGSVLPSFSVLGAKSLLNKPYTEEWKLYAGVPAKLVSSIHEEDKYFSRTEGFVY